MNRTGVIDVHICSGKSFNVRDKKGNQSLVFITSLLL